MFVCTFVLIYVGKPAEVLRNIDDTLVVDLELEESLHSTSTVSSSYLDSINLNDNSQTERDKDSVLLEEHSESGSIQLGVYASYWKAVGHLLSLSILISVTVMQLSRNTTDWWLAHWVTDAGGNATNSTNVSTFVEPSHVVTYDMDTYLKIYVELAVLNTVFTLIRAFIFAFGGIVAALKFHKLLLKTVMKVNMQV